jgi:hypothetical protein
LENFNYQQLSPLRTFMKKISLTFTEYQSWAFATFSPIRSSATSTPLFAIATPLLFPKIAIRYSLFAIATFVSSVLRTASILGAISSVKDPQH